MLASFRYWIEKLYEPSHLSQIVNFPYSDGSGYEADGMDYFFYCIILIVIVKYYVIMNGFMLEFIQNVLVVSK